MTKSFNEWLEEQLQDDEFRQEYEALEDEYEAVHQLILDRLRREHEALLEELEDAEDALDVLLRRGEPTEDFNELGLTDEADDAIL